MALLEHTGYPGLCVEPAEIVSILGAPGSGKSRLALQLAFLQRPAAGAVLLRGEDVSAKRSRLNPTRRPQDVTILVQNAEDQLFARTVFDDVAFGPRRLHLESDEIERRVHEALLAVRLDPYEVHDRSPFDLSGGERRRVALAGVLAMEPDVLILDEPTANLDPQTRHEFADLLGPLRGRSAVVWLTTSADEATAASRAYLLQDGKVREVQAGKALYEDWRSLERAGVELPDIYDLAEALERRGAHLPSSETPADMRQAIMQLWQGERRDH